MVFSSQVRGDIRLRPLLLVLCGAPFVASLDLFVVNIALGDIAASYPGYSLGDLSWVLNGYAIVYAALLVPLGRWADRIGHRRGFMLGLALFTAASAACALSPSLWFLVLFRLLQAVGAAALTPQASDCWSEPPPRNDAPAQSACGRPLVRQPPHSAPSSAESSSRPPGAGRSSSTFRSESHS